MLSGASGPISLGVRGSALVRALVEARGTVVSKNALMDAAWPGMAVEESNLTVQIAAIRRVLGEGWIATAARQGYRITVPVTEDDDAPDSAVRATLAVLPLDGDTDGNERERYFSDGVTHEVITSLLRFAGITIIAANSSFRYRGDIIDSEKIGRELAVRYVATVGVQRAGSRVRVRVRLDRRGDPVGPLGGSL